MTMPLVVIAQAIAIAALPTFSAQAARGQVDELRSTLADTLRGVLLLSVPATLGLILLRRPVVAALFQRGEFDARSTELVAWALLWYTAGLVGHSLVEILSRAFYSLHDTKTPVLVGTVAMTLNVLFSIGFSALFTRIGWMPHGGLALANSLATALEMAGLIFLMRGRLKGLNGQNIWSGAGQAGFASLAMALAIWGWLGLTNGQPAWLVAAGGIALGGGIYCILLLLFKVREAQALLGVLRRRVLAR
jgi:putative peptidoglycan lipid II flippase